MMTKYEALLAEVECIQAAWGYSDFLDALGYILENREQYTGTRVGRELVEFMADGRKMFAVA
jgi:hypothetical protein